MACVGFATGVGRGVFLHMKRNKEGFNVFSCHLPLMEGNVYLFSAISTIVFS